MNTTVAPRWAAAAARNDGLILRAFEEAPDWYPEKVEARLVEAPDGCLVWAGGRSQKGYGHVALPARVARSASGGPVMVRAHRVTYLREHGSIPFGFTLDHLCRETACAAPDHLRAVTIGENSLAPGATTVAALNAAKTHCPRGHLLDGDNLRPSGLARGGRECLTCDREASRETQALIRDAHMGLGISRREYRALFGQSRRVAEDILDRLASGVRPEVVLSGARLAASARWSA